MLVESFGNIVHDNKLRHANAAETVRKHYTDITETGSISIL